LIDTKNLRCKRLEETDDLSGFSCSNNDELGINEFIHDKALIDQKDHKRVTTVFYYVPQRWHRTIVGFISLRAWNEVTKLKGLPSIKISYLGVDNHWRNKGIGTQILLWGLGQAQKMNTCCAVAYVVLDTSPNLAKTFYKDITGVLNEKVGASYGFELIRLYKEVPEFASKAKLKEFS